MHIKSNILRNIISLTKLEIRALKFNFHLDLNFESKSPKSYPYPVKQWVLTEPNIYKITWLNIAYKVWIKDDSIIVYREKATATNGDLNTKLSPIGTVRRHYGGWEVKFIINDTSMSLLSSTTFDRLHALLNNKIIIWTSTATVYMRKLLHDPAKCKIYYWVYLLKLSLSTE